MECLRDDGIATDLRKFHWLLRYCLVVTIAVLTSSTGLSQEFDATTYHLPLVLPGINRNHVRVDQLKQRLSAALAELPCANPVACENALPGTAPSEWSILEPGDTSILGFATEQSVNAGDTVHFKIKTAALSYHIDILRVGWYQGNGARKVVSALRAASALPQTQPDCLVDTSNSTGLIDCGNWAESASWTVPTTAVSGVYFARLVRDDNGGSSYIFFVVRDDKSQSDIIYQTSDTTSAAYNPYGGNSLYQCQVSCPPGNPLVYKGAFKVSFNRPNIATSLGMQYSFFGAEFEMVEFLEANGYDVSYISGVDSDRNGELLKHHHVFISSGHDEYWSGKQRENVEAALNDGVHLAFFSGNEIFWKTRYEKSIDDSHTPYRTLVCYKETHFNAAIGPLDHTWTGTWRDWRFSPPADGGRPENALTGTAYMVDPPASFAIEVPAVDGAMRFWRNTTVATQATGQTATLAPNTLGYEWDEDLDNGARPAGIVHLSTTTHSVSNLLADVGNTVTPGVATHHLTLHRVKKALVFGAGTVQWSWGLEGSPDGTAGPDVRMQQATVNLLADMGVQTTTLIIGLTPASASTDTSPPVSLIATPSAHTSVQSNSTVTITGTASDTGGGAVGAVEVSMDDGKTWHPAAGRENWIFQWTPLKTGDVNLRSRAVDDSANLETHLNSVPVKVTPRSCPCSIWPPTAAPVITASADAVPVELGVKFFADSDGLVTGVRFFKSDINTGTHVASLWTANGTLLATATFTGETASGWQQVTLSEPVAITSHTHYVVSYHTDTGHYAYDPDYFSRDNFDNPPLHALKSGTDGGNGLYVYGTSAFPVNAYRSSTYWVDVVFIPTK